jgi:hypothetical protein
MFSDSRELVMKLCSQFFRPMLLRCLLVGLALGVTAAAAPVTTNTPAPSAKDASLATPESPATQSVFVVPAKPVEGKDPFFPRSTRVYGTTAAPKPGVVKPTITAELTLGGISGTPERPLAIINNYTFTTGEEREVATGGARLRIRCLEINMAAGSVLVQIGSERRELRLHKP